MDQRPAQSVVVTEFNGMYSDCDPSACPDGTMAQQINMMSVVNGQRTTRGGLKVVTLDTVAE